MTGIRYTHPNLYKVYLLYAALNIALGLNFIFLTPAFMPLDAPKWPIGLIFLGTGFVKFFLLVLGNASHKLLRHSMALSVAILSAWAGATTFDFFYRSLTSMQLPITYIGLAVIGLLFLAEPFTNPASATKNGTSK